MTYIVLETHLSYSVVMDEAGRVLKVANMQHEIGQILHEVVAFEKPKTKVFSAKTISALGALAACFVLMFTMYWNSYMSPIGSIYLIINPEVRLEISKSDKVVGLEGMNDDGKSLINGYSYRGKSITQVTDDLVDLAVELGFLSDGGMVTVNIDSPDEAWFTSTGITLRQNLNEHLSERMTVTIKVTQYASAQDPASDYGETQIPIIAPTAPISSAPVVLPPTNGDSSYGDSAYDTVAPIIDDGDSGYDEPVIDDDDNDDDDADDVDSEYGDTDD